MTSAYQGPLADTFVPLTSSYKTTGAMEIGAVFLKREI